MSGTDRTALEIATLREFIARATGSLRGGRDANELTVLREKLIGYVWAEQEHRVVYECLRSAQQHHAVPLREQMASQATRIGHPDVDWDLYFQPSRSDADLAELVRRLTNNP